MSGMISNPKYKGYYVGNKVRIVDMFTKKQKFLPPEEWVMFKDESGEIVPAIVSEELWDAANAVLTRRSKDVKRRQNLCNHDNLLTGKLYCTHCGAGLLPTRCQRPERQRQQQVGLLRQDQKRKGLLPFPAAVRAGVEAGFDGRVQGSGRQCR